MIVDKGFVFFSDESDERALIYHLHVPIFHGSVSNPVNGYGIAAYKKRFFIEEMFRDFKSSGYNMESTNVSGDRLISLILLITFAYSLATFKGQKIKSKGVQKYIGRVKEYGRFQRRHSSFYIGLYGESVLQEGQPDLGDYEPEGTKLG